jgi:hypothetical protein
MLVPQHGNPKIAATHNRSNIMPGNQLKLSEDTMVFRQIPRRTDCWSRIAQLFEYFPTRRVPSILTA